jgi:hypothetical protein
MFAALLSLAVVVEEAEEPSKTLFYVLGGLLAVFAVAVASLGIVREDFPASRGAARGVMALAALLVLSTMASAVITS